MIEELASNGVQGVRAVRGRELGAGRGQRVLLSPDCSTGSTPSTPTPTTPGSIGLCPINALKLGVCADVLGLVQAQVGTPPALPCCSLLKGLVDLEAAVCLCTAVKANVLGIQLNLPINLSLILNYCGMNVPSGFQC